jgi:hypothetical protein
MRSLAGGVTPGLNRRSEMAKAAKKTAAKPAPKKSAPPAKGK